MQRFKIRLCILALPQHRTLFFLFLYFFFVYKQLEIVWVSSYSSKVAVDDVLYYPNQSKMKYLKHSRMLTLQLYMIFYSASKVLLTIQYLLFCLCYNKSLLSYFLFISFFVYHLKTIILIVYLTLNLLSNTFLFLAEIYLFFRVILTAPSEVQLSCLLSAILLVK